MTEPAADEAFQAPNPTHRPAPRPLETRTSAAGGTGGRERPSQGATPRRPQGSQLGWAPASAPPAPPGGCCTQPGNVTASPLPPIGPRCRPPRPPDLLYLPLSAASHLRAPMCRGFPTKAAACGSRPAGPRPPQGIATLDECPRSHRYQRPRAERARRMAASRSRALGL